MFFLMFYLCFTNAILMSHICFAYVSRLFYLCCTYVFTFASWPVGLRYWLPMIGPMLYMSQFVQESIYSENGNSWNSWNSQVWTVITCSPSNFRSDYPKLDSTCQLLHSWTPTPTWPLCSLHGTVDPPSGGRPEPIGSAKDWIPHDIQSLVSLSRQIL